MKIKPKNYVSVFFTTLLTIFPLLSIYSTPIPSITMADILLLGFYPVIILYFIKYRDNLNIKIYYPFLIYTFYILIQLLCIGLLKDLEYFNKILLPSLRYLFYLITIVFFVKSLFDINLGVKILKIIALVSSIVLIMQFIIHSITGIYIKAYIPYLQLMNGDIANFGINAMKGSLRPRSFFSEPAHFCQYVLLALGLNMLKLKYNYKDYIYNMIIFLGILISGSSTGILVSLIILGIVLIKNIKQSNLKNKFKKIMQIFICTPIFFTTALKINGVQIFINRTFLAKEGNAAVGRLGNYSLIFNNKDISILELLFGHGIYKIDIYIPTIPRIYFYFGIIGSIFLSLVFILIIIKKEEQNRMTCIIFIILFIGTELFFGPFILLYMPFIICKYYNKADIINIKEVTTE